MHCTIIALQSHPVLACLGDRRALAPHRRWHRNNPEELLPNRPRSLLCRDFFLLRPSSHLPSSSSLIKSPRKHTESPSNQAFPHWTALHMTGAPLLSLRSGIPHGQARKMQALRLSHTPRRPFESFRRTHSHLSAACCPLHVLASRSSFLAISEFLSFSLRAPAMRSRG